MIVFNARNVAVPWNISQINNFLYPSFWFNRAKVEPLIILWHPVLTNISSKEKHQKIGISMSQRHLMFLQKDGSGIVVEALGSSGYESLKQEAEAKGMTCQPLSMEDFYPDYRGYRYFDLRNSVTRETFSIDHVLEAWEADKRHHEGHEGTEEWFIH